MNCPAKLDGSILYLLLSCIRFITPKVKITSSRDLVSTKTRRVKGWLARAISFQTIRQIIITTTTSQQHRSQHRQQNNIILEPLFYFCKIMPNHGERSISATALAITFLCFPPSMSSSPPSPPSLLPQHQSRPCGPTSTSQLCPGGPRTVTSPTTLLPATANMAKQDDTSIGLFCPAPLQRNNECEYCCVN